MINWKEYEGHQIDLKGKRKLFDNTIFTFDIETSSYIVLNNKQYNSLDYLNFNQTEKDNCIFMSNMYIWMFGINDTVYYGRTWNELYLFLERLDFFDPNIKKYVFVHNLSFEFQFLRNILSFKNVFSRKQRKVIKTELADYNIEFRCTYYMTNLKLEKLPEIYKLPVKKLTGNLDYNKIRHSQTILTKDELAYCENDCLVVYEYIKLQLETFKELKNLPLTSTGFVRKELKEKLVKNYSYKKRVSKCINVDGHIFNLMTDAFAGGYTHANWSMSNEIIDNVISYDFTSSYPYCLLTEKYPSSMFRKCNIKDYRQLLDEFCYIIKVKFKNIKCNYYNNFISYSKCTNIKSGKYDNGRIISADEIEIVLTDVDLRFIFDTYSFDDYNFEEVYWSYKKYLPKEYLEFILEKYENKTKYKGVIGKEIEYSLEKGKFNSIYGMTVTNDIRDKVSFDNIEWKEEILNNSEIIELLNQQQKQGFLSYSWGIFCTAYARNNLLRNLIKLDKYVIYSDTDSLKLRKGFNQKIIEDYNLSVLNKIEKVAKYLNFNIEKFKPKDNKGIEHCLGLFEKDEEYYQFKTLGAKKYVYTKWKRLDKVDKDIDNILKIDNDKALILGITISGVPKKGAKALRNLKDFKDDFVFEYKYTNKNMVSYNDDMKPFNLTDYKGKEMEVTDKFGICLVPVQYKVGISEEYSDLISDESSKRAIFKESI